VIRNKTEILNLKTRKTQVPRVFNPIFYTLNGRVRNAVQLLFLVPSGFHLSDHRIYFIHIYIYSNLHVDPKPLYSSSIDHRKCKLRSRTYKKKKKKKERLSDRENGG